MQTQRFSDRSSQSRFDAEQSLNARCSELVLMRVYFTQQQQTKKKRKRLTAAANEEKEEKEKAQQQIGCAAISLGPAPA